MKSVRLLVVLSGILFLLGMFDQFANKTAEKKTNKETAKQSSKPAISPSPSPIPSPITTLVSPFPTNTPQESNETSFVYPNSTITSSSENSYELRTSDDPETVTNWYKEKINSGEYSARSTVTTKTTGNVLNKISAAGKNKIEIEIKKDNSSDTVQILIKFS